MRKQNQQINNQQLSNATSVSPQPVSNVSITAGSQQKNARAAHARNPSPIRSQKISHNEKSRGQRDSPSKRYQNFAAHQNHEFTQQVLGSPMGVPGSPLFHVQGENKLIQNRSQNAVDMNEVIQFRLRQHTNEGTQASFDSITNFGNVIYHEPLRQSKATENENQLQFNENLDTMTGNLLPKTGVDKSGDARVNDSGHSGLSPHYAQMVIGVKHKKKQKAPGEIHRIAESRSSLVIPAPSSQRQDSKQLEEVSGGAARRQNQIDDKASIDSSPSLPYNTDINVEKIQIRQSKDDTATANLKGMRKAATNANMLQLSFKQSNVEFVDRKQQNSMLLDLATRHPNRNSDNMSPVIITSLDRSPRKPANSIVFDVRSETPKSQTRNSPPVNSGGVDRKTNNEDVKTRNISNYHDTENAATPTKQGLADDNEGRQSSPKLLQPVINPNKIHVNSVGEPFEVSPQQGPTKPHVQNQQMRSSSNHRHGLNTMSIQLFEEGLLKSQNQVAPFRQSNHLKGANQAKLMASLEQIAVENENEEQMALYEKQMQNTVITEEGTNKDSEVARIVAGAASGPVINMQDSQSQTANLTSYSEVKPFPSAADETTKLVFKLAIKEHETVSKKKWRNMTPYERSKVLQTFLRMQRETRETPKVLSVKNPHRIQQDLSMCISVGTVKAGPNPHVKLVEKRLGFQQNSNLKFDSQTLKDPKRIVQKVVKMQTDETIADAHQLDEQKDNVLHNDESIVISENNGMLSKDMGSMTESQMLEELAKVRQQKEFLVKQHPELLGAVEPMIQVSPQKSVLHMRYPYNSDISVIESQTQLKPIMAGTDLQQPSGLESSLQPHSPEPASTAMRLESQNNVATPLCLSPILNPQFNQLRTVVNSKNDSSHTLALKESSAADNNNPRCDARGMENVANNNPVTGFDSQEPQLTTVPAQMGSMNLHTVVSGDALPAVPEEQLNQTAESLTNKIKETLWQTDSESFQHFAQASAHSSVRPQAHQVNQQPYTLNVPSQAIACHSLTKSQEELLEMTQMSLQAISLTKKHKMAMTQVSPMIRTVEVDNQYLQAPKQLIQVHTASLNKAGTTTAAVNMNPQQLVSTQAASNRQQYQLSPASHRLSYASGEQNLGQLRSREQLTAEELKASLIDLKPTVHQQQLNKPKVAPTAKVQTMRKDANELENLPKFVEDNAAKAENYELLILENRLRDHHGIHKVDSSGGISDRPSQLTHLKEPKLIQNFNQKARELEQMILEHAVSTTSEKYLNNQIWDGNENKSDQESNLRFERNNSTKQMRMTQQASVGMIVGKRMEQQRQVIHSLNKSSSPQHASKQSNKNTSHIEVLQGKQKLLGAQNRSKQNFKPLKESLNEPNRVQIVDQAPKETSAAKDQIGLSSSQKQSLNENRLDESSIATHKIQESTGQGGGHHGLADFVTRNALHAQLHVGASYTFYNEQSNSKLENKEEALRAKASSQLDHLKSRPHVEERDIQIDHESSVVYDGDPASDQKTPGPISAETPIKLKRNQQPAEVPPLPQSKLINIAEGEQTALKEQTLETVLKQLNEMAKVDIDSTSGLAIGLGANDSIIEGFQETANFAAYANKSTGLPVSGPIKERNPQKQSFAATMVSILGSPAQAAARSINLLTTASPRAGNRLIHKRVNSTTFVGGKTRNSRMNMSIGQIFDSDLAKSIYSIAAQEEKERLEAASTSQVQHFGPQDVFVDRRVQQGQKLFSHQIKSPSVRLRQTSEVNATNLGFAMSPLARRGQQLITHTARRQQVAQIKTPLSKLLTANEMAEFQRVMLGSKTSKAVQSPGQYFTSEPPTRELVLNQVSTSRIVVDPLGQSKASKLELKSAMSGYESPTQILSPLMKSGHQQTTHWKPIRASKPVFGPVKASKENSLIEQSSQSMNINNSSSPRSLARNDTAEQANSSRYEKGKSGRKWLGGGTLRSTRYLNNNMSVDDVKMVGFAAVINQTEAQSKVGFSDLNSVLSSKQQMRRARPDTMIDSNSQTDLAQIGGAEPSVQADQNQAAQADSKASEQNPSEKNTLGGAPFEDEDKEVQQQQIVIAPFDSSHANSASSMTNRQRMHRKSSINAKSNSSSKLKQQYIEAQESQYTIVENQIVRVTKGVLPRYKVQLSKKQHLAEQVRQRYTSVQRDAQTLPAKRRYIEQSQNQFTKVELSRNKLKQRSSTLTSQQYFVFNDVNNWKKSMAQNSNLIAGGELLQSSVNKYNTIEPNPSYHR